MAKINKAALNFNGGGVTVANAPVLSGITGYTFECKFKIDNVKTGGRLFGESTSAGITWGLAVNPGLFSLDIYRSGWYRASLSYNFTLNEHNAVSFTMQNGTQGVYLNGVKIGVMNMSTITTSGSILSQIGLATGVNGFKGIIDEVRVWKKILSDSEIADKAKRYVYDDELADTLFYFRCDEGIGNKINDSGPSKAYTGTIGSGVTWETDDLYDYGDTTARILIPNNAMIVPKNTDAYMPFSIVPPTVLRQTDTMQLLDAGELGSGRMFEIELDKTKWAKINGLKIK